MDQVTAWVLERFDVKQHNLQDRYANATAIECGKVHYDLVVLTAKWEWRRDDMATLVHELHHVTTSILHRKGLELTKDTEECWAYLQDSLFTRFMWALRNRRKVMQKPSEKRVLRKPVAKKRRKG